MEARYIHGQKRNVYILRWSRSEDFQHQVGDPPTVLDLHSNSPVRLI
jgi:hypothetical protein